MLDDALHYLKARGLVANHCTNATPSEYKVIEQKHLPTPQMEIKALVTMKGPRLFVWSGHEKSSVAQMVELYRVHLKKLQSQTIGDLHTYHDMLAYTLAKRRSLQNWRSFAVADSVCQLVERLVNPRLPIQSRTNPKSGFVFTGQGAQWAGMGKELMVFPAFRNSILAADKFLASIGSTWKTSGMCFYMDP